MKRLTSILPMRKIISMILCAIMTMSTMAVNVFADESNLAVQPHEYTTSFTKYFDMFDEGSDVYETPLGYDITFDECYGEVSIPYEKLGGSNWQVENALLKDGYIKFFVVKANSKMHLKYTENNQYIDILVPTEYHSEFVSNGWVYEGIQCVRLSVGVLVGAPLGEYADLEDLGKTFNAVSNKEAWYLMKKGISLYVSEATPTNIGEDFSDGDGLKNRIPLCGVIAVSDEEIEQFKNEKQATFQHYEDNKNVNLSEVYELLFGEQPLAQNYSAVDIKTYKYEKNSSNKMFSIRMANNSPNACNTRSLFILGNTVINKSTGEKYEAAIGYCDIAENFNAFEEKCYTISFGNNSGGKFFTIASNLDTENEINDAFGNMFLVIIQFENQEEFYSFMADINNNNIFDLSSRENLKKNSDWISQFTGGNH